MNVRAFAAAVLVAALAVAAVGATGASGGKTADTLTVWLQVDAQSGWPEVVAAATAQFKAQNPGWDVDVQYQTWNTHLSKFDATLAGNSAPDVIEMGNTEMTKYMAAGAFQDLTANTFPNKSTWLAGLAKSGQYGGKIYGVPYYAGSRVITYRTDLFRAVNGKIPTSVAEFSALARKLGAKNKEKSFSPVYIAGTDWYFAMSFVYDYGGTIAVTNKGKWIGTLDRPKAVAGLTAFKRFYDAASRASKTTDEVRPNPYDVYAQGNAASIQGHCRIVRLLATCGLPASFTATPRATLRRSRALPGSAAVSVTSRTAPRSSSCRVARRASRFRASSAARISPSRSAPTRHRLRPGSPPSRTTLR